MKNFKYIFVVVVFLLSLSKSWAQVTYPIAIDSTNFPDETFRNYVSSNWDKNNNGNLEYDEAADVIKISMESNTSVGEVNAIFFPNLKELSLNKCTALKKVDLTGCSNLETVNLQKDTSLTSLTMPETHMLKSFNISECHALTGLSMGESNSTTALNIDISGLRALETFYGKYLHNLSELKGQWSSDTVNDIRSLKTLDLSGCTNIKKIDLYRCKKLKTIILPNEHLLETFSARECCLLTSLNMGESKSTNPLIVKIDGCQCLKSFDGSKLYNLKEFICSGVEASSNWFQKCENLNYVNLSGCTNLEEVYINQSPLANGITMPSEHNLKTFKAYRCQQLTSLVMGNSKSTEDLDVRIRGCQSLVSFDGSGLGNLKILECSQENPEPTNFYQKCESLSEVNISGCDNIEEIWLSASLISSIALPSDLASLKKVYANKCSKLNSLDLSTAVNIEIVTVNEDKELTKLLLPKECAYLNKFHAASCLYSILEMPSSTPLLTNVKVSGNLLTAFKLDSTATLSTADLDQELYVTLDYVNGCFAIPVSANFDYSKLINPKFDGLDNSENTSFINGDTKYIGISKGIAIEETTMFNKAFEYDYITDVEGTGQYMHVKIHCVPVTYWTGGKNDYWEEDKNWTKGKPDNTKAAFVGAIESDNKYPVIRSFSGTTQTYYAKSLHLSNNSKVVIEPGYALVVNSSEQGQGVIVTEPGSYIELLADTDVADEKNANRTVGAQLYGKYYSTSEKEITGECNVKVQRYFRYKKWDRFAVPVYNCNSTALQGNYSYNPYLYTYNESYCFNEKYSAIFSVDNNFADSVSKYLGVAWEKVPGSLYAKRHVYQPGVGYNFYCFEQNKSLFFTGTTKNAPLTIKLSYTKNDDGVAEVDANHKAANGLDGWNYVGNPYTVAIDWKNVSKIGINGSAYIFDNDDNKYYVCNSDGTTNTLKSGVTGVVTNNHNPQYILPTQGFFVRANSSDALITLQYENVVVDKKSILKSTTVDFNKIKLLISNGEDFDITTIYFRDGATQNFDNAYDAYKMYNGSLDLYSVTPQGNYCINALDSQTDSTVINIGFIATQSGSYTLSAGELTLNQGNVYLVDSLLGNVVDITNDSYEFETASGSINNRFYLVFKNMNPAPEPEQVEVEEIQTEENTIEQEVVELDNQVEYVPSSLLTEIENQPVETKDVKPVSTVDIKLWPNPATEKLNISVPEGCNSFRIYNQMGKLSLSGVLDSQTQIDISSLNSGLYIIRIANKSVKFIKQ